MESILIGRGYVHHRNCVVHTNMNVGCTTAVYAIFAIIIAYTVVVYAIKRICHYVHHRGLGTPPWYTCITLDLISAALTPQI